MKYNAINAKVAGMSAKLLSQGDYFELCGCLTAYDAAAALKNNAAYSWINNDRTSIESQLFPLLEYDFAKISGFIHDTDIRKYLECLLMKRHIFVTKKGLRLAYGEGININSFIEKIEVQGVREFLKSTFKPDMNLSQIEILLDLHYYTNLWKAKNKYLRGTNKAVAAHIAGTEIDMYNLSRIYGLKKYYKPSKELMYKYILPINYKVVPEIIGQMIETDNEAYAMELIRGTAYEPYFSEGGGDICKAVRDSCRRAKIKNPNSIAQILNYLFKKEVELRDIVSIFESLNYSLEPNEIMNKLHYTDRREVHA